MAEFNPYTLEEEKWTPKNVYEILPPNAVSWSDYDFGAGTDNVDKEAANKSLIDGFVDFFKELFGTAGAILGGAIELGGAILGGFVNGVINFIGGIANAIGSIFGGGPTESPYPPMFSPIKANLEAAIQPFKDQIEESKQKSEDLLAEQLDIRGQIAEQIEIAKAAIEDAKAASERAGVAIEDAKAAGAAAKSAREQLEAYNAELNERITTEFNSAVGRANAAVDKADSLAQQLEDFRTTAAADIESALGKAQTASEELAALSPQVSTALDNASAAVDKAEEVTSAYNTFATAQKARIDTAVTNASNAVTKANNVTTEYNNFKIEQQARIDSAVSKAEAASANVNALTPQVEEAVNNSAAATADVAALTPQVSEAVANASNAVSKADQTLADYTAWAAAQKTRIDSAVSKAEKATSDLAALSPQVESALEESSAANQKVADLTPQVSDAVAKAGSAVDKANQTFTDYTAWATAQKTRIDSAVAKAEKASSDLSAMSPRVDDAVSKASKATSDVSALTPKVTAAQTRADHAFTEAGKVRNEVTPKIADALDVGTSALGSAEKAVSWLRNPTEIGSSLIAVNPETKRPHYADDLELVTDNPPGTSGPTYMRPKDRSGNVSYGPNVPVDAKIKYTVSFWARADEPGSKIYGQFRTQEGRNVAPDGTSMSSGAINVSNPPQPSNKDANGKYVHGSAKNSYFIQDLELPTSWTYYEHEIEFSEGVTSVSISIIYWNHTRGVPANQYISGLDIRPQIPTQASVDQAQNDAIRANSEILRQQGEINAAQATANLAQKNFNDNQDKWNQSVDRSLATQKTVNDNFQKWTEGATTAIQANTDVAVALARINGIQVGGRNLLKKSALNLSNSSYPLGKADFGDSVPADGEEITISLKGSLGAGNERFGFYNSGGHTYIGGVYPSDRDSNGVYKVVTKWKSNGTDSHLNIYAMPNTATAASTVEWIKLERGNKATDWTLAPEDLPTQAQVDAAQDTALEAHDLLFKKQDEWNNGVTAALATQKTVNDNFSKWSDGAATAIEANTKAIALLNSPNGGSSLIPINPLTAEPYYLGWAGDRISVANIDTVPTRTAVKYTTSAKKRLYTPSDQLKAVKVSRGQVYRWTAWVYSNIANTGLLFYLRDPATGTGAKNTKHDEASGTRGHSSYGLWINGISSGWNRVSGTIEFKDEISAVEMYSIEWNQSNISSSVTQYVTGLDIAPDVPTQAQVDAAQNKAIETFDLFMGKQDEWNKGTTAALDAQKKVNDNFSKWSDGAATAIEANTQAIKALNAPQMGSSIVPLVPGTPEPAWASGLAKISRGALAQDSGLPEGVKEYYRWKGGVIPAGGSEGVGVGYGNLVTVDPNIDYEASWWVRCSAGSPRYIYITMADELGNQSIIQKSSDEAASSNTWGNSIRAIITGVPTTWTKYTTRFRFIEGTKAVRIADIQFNNSSNSSNAYMYVGGLEIAPKVPTQASVDAAQNDAIAANTKAIALLNNPQAGASLVVTDPDTKRPNWAEKLEPATAAENPNSLPDAYKAVPNTGSNTARDMWVNIDPTTEYVVSLWAKADKTGSNMTYDMRDQDGNLAFTTSRPVEGFLNAGNGSRPYWITNLPTKWTQYKAIITPRATSRKVRFAAAYFNHSAGTTTDATQFVADFQIYPHVPSQAQVDDAQNKAIESLGILTAKQKEWSDGAQKAIQANTDVAVALARINGIQIGGRNLLRGSNVNITTKDYLMTRIPFGDSPPTEGEQITISLKGVAGTGTTRFRFYNSNGNGSSSLGEVFVNDTPLAANGSYQTTLTWKETGGNSHLNIYAFPSSATAASTVEWIKLERGNKATDWTLAPEDLPTQKQVDDTQNTAIRANTDALKALGKKALGTSLVPFRTPTDDEIKNLSSLGYDPFAEPEYYDAGHVVDVSPGEGKRTPKALSTDTSKGFRGSYVPVDPALSYKVKFRTYAAAAGSGMSIALVDQNGSGAVASSPFASTTSTTGGYLAYRYELPQNWANHEGIITFKPGTTEVRFATFYWNTTAFSVSTTQRFFDLEIVPNVPTQDEVNLLQENAILKNTEIGSENKKAIDALTEGMGAYAAAADLENLHKNLQDELEKEQDARADLAAEINDLLVETIPRTIIYNSGAQFNDHVSAERYKVVAKGTWVGQMLLDVTYVSKSDGSQTRRVIQNLTVPAPDGSREYSVPSASFGGYSPAYRLDYWIYRGRSIQKALSNSGSYITGSSFTRNSWTRIATHTIGKSNGAVHILWRTVLTAADRGVTYSFDVRVNGTSVLDKHYKGYGPLTSFGDGRATLSFSGNLSVPDNGTVEIYAKASGTSSQARVSSNKGTLTYLELEK